MVLFSLTSDKGKILSLWLIMLSLSGCRLFEVTRNPPRPESPPKPQNEEKKTWEPDNNRDSSGGLTPLQYAAACKKALGITDLKLPDLNCIEGVEVPVSVQGKAITVSQVDALASGELSCDYPSWLNHTHCTNYNYIYTTAITADIRLALVCRNRRFRNPKSLALREAAYRSDASMANFSDIFEFDSVGLILANENTGVTCFFNRQVGIYGGLVPAPDRAEKVTIDELPLPKPPSEFINDNKEKWAIASNDFWVPTNQLRADDCTDCHDHGPWINSPWLRQAGISLPNNPSIPLTVVGKDLFGWDSLPLSVIEPVADDLVAVNPAFQPCHSCHWLGARASCRDFVPFAVGQKHASVGSTAPDGYSPWMPPASLMGENLRSLYKSYLERYQCCCQTRDALGCRSRAISDNVSAFIEGKNVDRDCRDL